MLFQSILILLQFLILCVLRQKYFVVNVLIKRFVCPVACLTESFLTYVLYKLLLDFLTLILLTWRIW